ncbi:peptidylprolyl isomerase [Rhodohalobacter sp. 8-1]|uniref:peptidylprolyl isomerase n=1 Tax=Rhodohalobacter sp. 8-1 TaxID=3131972 RepID=UPI0030ECF0BD
MRNSTSSILWILIFSFGILWVLADVDFFGGMTQGPQNMGVVNGEPISIQEYNQRVSFYVDQYNQNQGGDMTPETRAMLEEQAWEDLVASRLVEQKMNELGITVTDRELLDMVTGENPAPFIRQQFSDQQGNIDRVALQAAIDAPENSEIWISIEQQLRDNRRQQKLNNFISAGLKISSLDVKNHHLRTNSFADISYVRFPYADVSEEDITVTEEELRAYLDNNPEQFQRAETYRFQYVQWNIEPTASDTANTIQDVENMRQRLEQAENDSLFFSRNLSATPYNGAYVERDQIREEYSTVLDLEEGEVSEVVMIDGDPHIFKKIDERGSEIKFAVFSYEVEADPVATVDRLAESAEEFEFYAAEEGFEVEAERRELDVRTATATEGNPFIPGLGQSQQVLSTLKRMRANDVSAPIELNNQFVVLQLLEKIPEGTRPLSEVRNQIENIVTNNKRRAEMLRRVREMTGVSADLETLAETAEKEVQSSENIRMSSATIPGAGREPKVVGAVFAVNEGDVTAPIEGETAVFVVRVDSKEMADAEQLTEAQRSQIRTQLEQQKVSTFNQVFIEELKENASITDNRNRLIR